jgi:hypothetical protein
MTEKMNIRELFRKPIDRPINGVIKADQRDAESIWQELDEYVVTKQLADYFRRFFDAYLAAGDNPTNSVITDRMGVWVSGFFGSGKSHFIKILSYLLENLDATDPVTGNTKRAAAFFDENKIKDPLLLADIQRATRGSADVILFNIDAKADSKSDRDVVLQVFLRVFNEKLGYSGDAPHIAEMERYLVSKGAYDTFQQEFKRIHGGPWATERDAFDFLRDEIAQALAIALMMSVESAQRWFDESRDSYKINIENFAKLLREYLGTKGKDHRIIFLVDEVGQFIGNNTQLMLNLQTIAEQLGTQCQGRAWVVVTSQEDIEAAIGEASKARSQDFSKIQGRFHTRLSLASSNTDEVIGVRLLAKTEAAHEALRNVFEQQGDIINNQISFNGNAVTMRGYRDSVDYVANYPFAPYQFELLQKIFEAIRKVGATGQHLSRGERSLLDAFQSAAKINADRSIQSLVPLYDFYPSIESFLDTTVKRAVDQAEQNPALEKQDIRLLKALFLIRHIAEVIKPTIDNLAALCLDQIDADKLQLKRQIQQSLERLEQQRLVNRNGDLWFFLTNEERDIAREIGHVDVSAAEKSKLLAEIVFDEILGGQTKVRHRDTKADYEFNRLLDGAPYRQANHALSLDIRSPLGDDYESLKPDRCIMLSAEGNGKALIRMGEGTRLDIELTLYRQIEKYVDSPKASAAPPSLRKILLERKDENRERRQRLVAQIGELIVQGDCYAKGQQVRTKAATASTLLDELINYLITNTYNKLPYLKIRKPDTIAEIRALLSADNVGQQELALGGEDGNPQAIDEVRQYLQLAASQNRVLLSDVVDRFTDIPYGWKPEWEVVLLVARLFMAGEIKLTMGGSDLDPRSAFDPLTKAVQHKQISILKRKAADAGSIARASDLYRQLFSSLPRKEEDGVVTDFRSKLVEWKDDLKRWQLTAGQLHYPGKITIDALLARCERQLAIRDPFEFIEALNKSRDEWLDAGEDLNDVRGFYTNQLPTWQRFLATLNRFEPNRDVLATEPKASVALKDLQRIREEPAPYASISQIEPLLATLEASNQALVQAQREAALRVVEQRIDEANKALVQAAASADLSNAALHPLQQLKLKIADAVSIPEIQFLSNGAGDKLDEAMDLIRDTLLKAHTAAQVASKAATASGATQASTSSVSASASAAAASAPKISQTIRPAELATSTYLETDAEVDTYLADLKTHFTAVLKSGKRIRIQ